jgi:hypothetical protein
MAQLNPIFACGEAGKQGSREAWGHGGGVKIPSTKSQAPNKFKILNLKKTD